MEANVRHIMLLGNVPYAYPNASDLEEILVIDAAGEARNHLRRVPAQRPHARRACELRLTHAGALCSPAGGMVNIARQLEARRRWHSQLYHAAAGFMAVMGEPASPAHPQHTHERLLRRVCGPAEQLACTPTQVHVPVNLQVVCCAKETANAPICMEASANMPICFTAGALLAYVRQSFVAEVDRWNGVDIAAAVKALEETNASPEAKEAERAKALQIQIARELTNCELSCWRTDTDRVEGDSVLFSRRTSPTNIAVKALSTTPLSQARAMQQRTLCLVSARATCPFPAGHTGARNGATPGGHGVLLTSCRWHLASFWHSLLLLGGLRYGRHSHGRRSRRCPRAKSC